MIKMKAFKVSEVNRYIKRLLSADPIVGHILVEGEISNFTKHSSGHAYFTVKDETSKMACVMFESNVAALPIRPREGDKVLLKGSVNVYERDGRYQLYVKSIEWLGKGALYEQFERLKATLAEKGYFDPAHKKPIPRFPKKIAVITSPTGAAVRDVLSVAERRTTVSEIVVIPALVQGQKAPNDIVAALREAERMAVDLIVLARGGGSIEELWAFNAIEIADALYHIEIPVVTGIGHETDFTIADFVADLRAATPSAAAEVALVSRDEIKMRLNQQLQLLMVAAKRQLDVKQLTLNQYGMQSIKGIVASRQERAGLLLDSLEKRMTAEIKREVALRSRALDALGEKLSAINPMAVLMRGYGIVYKEEAVVRSAEDISEKDVLKVEMVDGTMTVEVLDVTVKE